MSGIESFLLPPLIDDLTSKNSKVAGLVKKTVQMLRDEYRRGSFTTAKGIEAFYLAAKMAAKVRGKGLAISVSKGTLERAAKAALENHYDEIANRKENPMKKKTARRKNGFDSDKSIAIELAQYIETTPDLYKRNTLPIIYNLKKKIAKGAYDPTKALKLWKGLADVGAKMYNKENDSGIGFGDFTPSIRKLAAKELADMYSQHVNEKSVIRKPNPSRRISPQAEIKAAITEGLKSRYDRLKKVSPTAAKAFLAKVTPKYRPALTRKK